MKIYNNNLILTLKKFIFNIVLVIGGTIFLEYLNLTMTWTFYSYIDHTALVMMAFSIIVTFLSLFKVRPLWILILFLILFYIFEIIAFLGVFLSSCDTLERSKFNLKDNLAYIELKTQNAKYNALIITLKDDIKSCEAEKQKELSKYDKSFFETIQNINTNYSKQIESKNKELEGYNNKLIEIESKLLNTPKQIEEKIYKKDPIDSLINNVPFIPKDRKKVISILGFIITSSLQLLIFALGFVKSQVLQDAELKIAKTGSEMTSILVGSEMTKTGSEIPQKTGSEMKQKTGSEIKNINIDEIEKAIIQDISTGSEMNEIIKQDVSTGSEKINIDKVAISTGSKNGFINKKTGSDKIVKTGSNKTKKTGSEMKQKTGSNNKGVKSNLDKNAIYESYLSKKEEYKNLSDSKIMDKIMLEYGISESTLKRIKSEFKK